MEKTHAPPKFVPMTKITLAVTLEFDPIFPETDFFFGGVSAPVSKFADNRALCCLLEDGELSTLFDGGSVGAVLPVVSRLEN